MKKSVKFYVLLYSLFLCSCKEQNTEFYDDLFFESSKLTVTDIDGNNYKIIKIGNQLWMAENLKTTSYNDGSAIPNITNNADWTTLTNGAYCWYNNDISNKLTYGALYNYFTVVDSRRLCPTGWHVPTDAEWTTLETYLGGSSLAGGKLKDTTLWVSPNAGATNSSGFTALSGGRRTYNYGNYEFLGNLGYWWSTPESDADYPWIRIMSYNSSKISRGNSIENYGFSVRCIKNGSHTLPTVATNSVTVLSATSATCDVTITSDGGAAITERGVCYSTNQNPTISDTKVSSSGTTGSFTCNLTGLTANTLYYIRAYAINSVGAGYGNELNITTNTTSAVVPTITTTTTTTISLNTATCGGNVTSDGGATITERGVCYSTTQNPTTSSNKVMATGKIGTYTCNLSGLTANTLYYVRAYAINNIGAAYGNEINFTTNAFAVVPTLITSGTTSITPTTATCGGNVTSDGGAAITERGVCYSTTQNPTTSNNKVTATGTLGTFTCNLTGLTANTQYYVRAYAANGAGVAYGNEISFTTFSSSGEIPTNGLVAYYPFNGNSNDESGNGNTGINHGATLIADRFAIQDKAYSFNGSNWIDCGKGSNLQIADNITICFWLKTSNPGFAFPVIKEDTNNKVGWMLGFVDSGTQNIYFGCNDGTFRGYVSSPNTKDNQWHFIVAQREGTIVRIFKDGTKTGEADRVTLGNTNSSSFSLQIGYQYSGLIDDVRIFNRALSESEIYTLYHEGGF